MVALLTAQDGKGGEVLAAWPDLSKQVHAEDGCLGYDLHRVAGKPDEFVVLEQWASVGALAAHGKSPHMREFGARAKDMLAAPAQVIVVEAGPAA